MKTLKYNLVVINNNMENGMNLTLKVWRQANAESAGQMTEYKLGNVSPDMSFLEMMDVLNDKHRTHPANTLTAIMIESDGVFSIPDQLLVEHIKHFEETHLRRDVFNAVQFESTRSFAVRLSPNFQVQVHVIVFHISC